MTALSTTEEITLEDKNGEWKEHKTRNGRLWGQIPISLLFLIYTWLQLPSCFHRESDEIMCMKALTMLFYIARIKKKKESVVVLLEICDKVSPRTSNSTNARALP